MKMSSNTFFYFFSTIAQCLAALTGLAFVAIQMRIAFLDEKVTRAKRAVATILHGPMLPGAIEFEMAANEASEILREGKKKLANANPNNENHKLIESLETRIDESQQNRRQSIQFLTITILAMMLSLLQLPFSEYFADKNTCIKYFVIGSNLLILCSTITFITVMIMRVLDVRTIFRTHDDEESGT